MHWYTVKWLLALQNCDYSKKPGQGEKILRLDSQNFSKFSSQIERAILTHAY